MISNDKSAAKLLTKDQDQEHDHNEPAPGISLSVRIVTLAVAIAAAVILAFVLLPRIPLLELGETADHDIFAPYTLYIEYPGPDQTLSLKVNKGDLIVSQGHQVTENAERVPRKLPAGKASATGSMHTSACSFSSWQFSTCATVTSSVTGPRSFQNGKRSYYWSACCSPRSSCRRWQNMCCLSLGTSCISIS
jgi:hypothetical protein